MLLASDTVLPPACLYNPGNAIFPYRRRRHPFLRTVRDRGEGASVDGDGSGSHRALLPVVSGALSKNPSEKRKALVVVVSCGTSEGWKKTPARWRIRDGGWEREREEEETIYRFLLAGKEKPSISPSKMTIRRGWLGKRLFIAHIQRSAALVCIFRTESDEARRTRLT